MRNNHHNDPLAYLTAGLSGILGAGLMVEGDVASGLITIMVGTATAATLYALADYRGWDERREINASKAAKNVLKALLLVLGIGGVSIMNTKIGSMAAALAVVTLLVWGMIYYYYEWRDTL